MAKDIKAKGGIFRGNSHATGGIPLVVKETGQPIEVEGDEPLIPNEAMQDKNVKKRTGTNIEILHQINKKIGAKGMNEPAKEVHASDAIVCKRSAYDKTKRTYIGTDKQIVSAINKSGGCNEIEGGGKAIEPDGKVVEYKKGGETKKVGIAKKGILTPEEEAIIAKRWEKKKEHIHQLANSIQRLRLNVSNDLKSSNEKVFLTALVISLMDKTGERIGNNVSASNGHFGITGFRKKHIKISGNKITLDYVGKSGVEHEKIFTDSKLAPLLEKAIKNANGYFVFTTSDGFRIKGDRVNRYLTDFDITAKDLRGYCINRGIIDKLKDEPIPEEETKRKTFFNKMAKKVAHRIGHGTATLKKHYMIPELFTEYVEKGKIIDIKDMGYFKDGGAVKAPEKIIEKKVEEKIDKEKEKFEHGGRVGSKLTASEVEVKIGRKFGWWYDDEVLVDGVLYKKEFLKNSYKAVE